MFLTIKLCTYANCFLKMDLSFNNLQILIDHKTQTTNYNSSICVVLENLFNPT